MPKQEITEYYRPIGLEDVDTAIRDWFDFSVDAHVETPTSERHKVPIVFGSSERWVTARNTQGIRDNKGKLILPIISITRKSFNPNNTMAAFSVNVPRITVSRRISPKTSQLRNNDTERSLASRNGDAVVYEVTTIPFPSNGVATYQMVIHAQYTKQLNAIIEKLMYTLEFYEMPQFIAMLRDKKLTGTGDERTKELEVTSESPYESREPAKGYYVVGFFDTEIGDSGNFDEFTDEERIVRYTATFTVPVYMLLDPEGTSPAVTTKRTAFKIGFKDEEVTFVDDPYELELIFGNGKVEER